jgi:Glycosyltransferase family 87
MDAAAPARRHALDNGAFRSILLASAGTPIVGTYVWRALVQPIVLAGYLGDLQESYMRAAGRIAAGASPYDLCKTMGCLEPTGPQYVTPPLLAWILQPLVGVDARLVTVLVTVTLNVSLFVFLFFVLRAMDVKKMQLAALIVLMALAFEPVIGNIDEGQINNVMLGLSGIWLWSWIRDRWWGGAALGVAIALKLIQGPSGLLVLWGRRWAMFAVAAVAGLILWLVAVPQYAFEYVTAVLPAINQGTGFYENHSPGGTVARLFEPSTFLGATRGSPEPARLITLMIGVAAIVITVLVLRSPSETSTGRALEAAAAVALSPIVASYSWGTHLVLLLLPMSVLVVWGIRTRHWPVIGLVALGWLSIGPIHKGLQVLLATGDSNIVVLRLLTEFGPVGVLAIWVATLMAIRQERAAPSGLLRP